MGRQVKFHNMKTENELIQFLSPTTQIHWHPVQLTAIVNSVAHMYMIVLYILTSTTCSTCTYSHSNSNPSNELRVQSIC